MSPALYLQSRSASATASRAHYYITSYFRNSISWSSKIMPPRSKSPGGGAKKNGTSSSSSSSSGGDAQPGEVPLVGGFFLPRRQVYRASAIVAVFIAAMFGSGMVNGSSFENFAASLPAYLWPFHIFCFASWYNYFSAFLCLIFYLGLLRKYSFLVEEDP